MNLLALDTSTDYLSLALRYQGQLWTRDWHAPQKHAELTLPAVQALLVEAGASLQAVQGIALSIGPGSFTGLRIGCGMVQGLAYGLGIPTVGINTLAALAADSGAERVLTALDARMNEFYLAAWEKTHSGWQQALPTTVCGAANLPALQGEGWTGVGSGFAVPGEALAQRYGKQLAHIDASRFPHARGVLLLAENEFAAGRGVPAAQLELTYIRDKVALKTSERQKA